MMAQELLVVAMASLCGGGIGALLSNIAWAWRLEREFDPRSRKSVYDLQRRVWLRLEYLCKDDRTTVELGEPDDGYDFLVRREGRPSLLVEVKSPYTWKYPTTYVVRQAVRRIDDARAKLPAKRAVIVLEDRDRLPCWYLPKDDYPKIQWGELPKNIAVSEVSTLKLD